MRHSSQNRFIRSIHPLLLPVLLVAVVGGLTGCAVGDDEGGYSGQCSLPADQSKTLTGRWRTAPVYLAFRNGHFNTYEQGLMMNAIDVWNRYTLATQGFEIFDYGSREVPRASNNEKPSGGICSLNIVNASGSFNGAVVIHKRSTWPYTSQSSAIAITTICAPSATPAVPLQPMYNAVLEINFENFFIAGKQVPDLTTLLVHELGHMIGLDHSCATQYDSTSATHPPLCSSSSLDPLYYEAAMYPTVNFKSDGTGYVRRALNFNDQGRASCLYGETAL